MVEVRFRRSIVSTSSTLVFPANGDPAASVCDVLSNIEARSKVPAHHSSHGGLGKVHLGWGEHPVLGGCVEEECACVRGLCRGRVCMCEGAGECACVRGLESVPV